MAGAVHYSRPDLQTQEHRATSSCGRDLRNLIWSPRIHEVTCKNCLNSFGGQKALAEAGIPSIDALSQKPPIVSITYSPMSLGGRPCIATSEVTLTELLALIAADCDFDNICEVTGLQEELIVQALVDLSRLLDCDWALLRGDRKYRG